MGDDSRAELAESLARGARERREQLVEMLARLTADDAPSGDPEALEPVAALLESWLGALPARTARHPTPAGPLLEAELGPAEGPEVLLLCHYDTVWPRGTVAARPFRIEDGVARGPGVVDMRGGIVAVLGALGLLGELDALERPVRLLITPDEETGSEASREAIAAAARGAAIVLVPEPALPGGSLKTSRKGWLLYRVTATGRAAHAGLEPERGVSAVEELLDCLLDLRGLADPAAGTTVNYGLLSAPNVANMVADRAEATVDVRVPDGSEEARVRERIAALAPRRQGAWLAVEELHSRPPLERSPAVAAAAEGARELARLQGLELGEGHAGGVSDANLAAAEGVAVLDGLGPEGGGAHAVDEHVVLASLVERTALIALLVAAL